MVAPPLAWGETRNKTMTEWYDLPTDREMDIQVLEIMGFPRKKLFYDDWDTDRRYLRYIPSGKPRRTHAIDAKLVPYFDTDIAAAFQLVEWQRKQWVGTAACWVFKDRGDDGWRVEIKRGIGTEGAATAETLPAAIVRAFVLHTALKRSVKA